MRCKICNTVLQNWETTKTDYRTGEYTDTCGTCATYIGKDLSDAPLEPSDSLFVENTVDKDF